MKDKIIRYETILLTCDELEELAQALDKSETKIKFIAGEVFVLRGENE